VTAKGVSVVGAGTMGRGIAQLLATENVSVTLIDRDEKIAKQAKDRIAEQVEFLLAENLMKEKNSSEEILSRIRVSTDLADAADSWLVIEAVPEILQLKQMIFAQLEERCDSSVIFATNTSGIPIRDIGRSLRHPDRLLGTHFFMPAHIVPLVEVIKGPATSMNVIDLVIQFLKEIEKQPVLIQKEVPGFIGNRIQHAIAREAISLVEKGVASPEDIDTVVRYSLGLRLVFTGPLEQRDWNGLDIHHHIASYLYEDLESRTTPSSVLTDKVEKGDLGVKTGRGFFDWEGKHTSEISQRKDLQLLRLIRWLKNKE